MISQSKLLELAWGLIWRDLTQSKKTIDYPLGTGIIDYDTSKLPVRSAHPHLFWIKDSNLRNLKIEIDNAEKYLYLWVRAREDERPEFITPFRKLSLKVHHTLSAFLFEKDHESDKKDDGSISFDGKTIAGKLVFKDRIEDVIKARESMSNTDYVIVFLESDQDLDFRIKKEAGKKIGFLHFFSKEDSK